MTDNKKQDSKGDKTKTFNIKTKLMIILLILLVGSSYYFYKYWQFLNSPQDQADVHTVSKIITDIDDGLTNNTTKVLNKSDQQEEQIDTLTQEEAEKDNIQDEGFSFFNVQLPKFAPKQDINSDIDTKNTVNDNPYESAIAEEDNDDLDDIKLENLTIYRKYLANTTRLLIKFNQDISYSKELKIMAKLPVTTNLPDNFEETIILLQKYNQLLLNKDQLKEKIFPSQYEALEKFIKIEKTTKAYEQKELLKIAINKRLDNFLNYLYSFAMQERFQ
ncbi:MAG: hypothetical protein HRU35_04395 [Rickettsiaceae bacterium]|nr:hypothetical protein [Rickettsiaceae bacterium]